LETPVLAGVSYLLAVNHGSSLQERESRIKRAPQRGRPHSHPGTPELAEILICDLGQVEHGDLTPIVEQRTELLVGVDRPPILGVLQPIPFDIRPEFADDLRPGHWAVADDGGELCAGLQRSHECGIRGALLTGRGFLSGGFLGCLLPCCWPT